MKKAIRRLLTLTLCLACLLSALSTVACAIEPIDLEREVSVSVTFQKGGTCIPNAEFSLYRVADISEWAEFTLCGDFAGYLGQLGGFETVYEWDGAANQLKEYAAAHKIAPLLLGKTDAQGKVTFSGGMKPGLYLLTCGETEYKDKIYTALPCLVCLPNREAGSDEWLYEDAPVVIKPGEVKDIPPDIPQTGMLWWPVPVLLTAGLLCVVIGLTRRRSTQHEA